MFKMILNFIQLILNLEYLTQNNLPHYLVFFPRINFKA